MASSIIHIAVANELNKKLNKEKSELLIGTIAPDISKLVGETKEKSHFLDTQEKDDNNPNLKRFLNKYQNYLSNTFVLGYYIHLYTDYLWFKYFLPGIYEKDLITKLDGTIVKCHGGMTKLYIYNDYTNLNTKLIDEYNLDLKIFYMDIPEFKKIIEEIPMEKLHLIINKTGEIIMNSKVHKDMVFNMEYVNHFIKLCVDIISEDLKELKIM